MTRQFQVESFLCAANEVVFFLNAGKLPLENANGIHGSVGAHVSLHRPCLLPFLQNLVDFVLYYLVLRNNFQLQPS